MPSNSDSTSTNFIESMKLFENLQDLSLLDICDQLDSCSLVLVSLLSNNKKWEQLVRRNGKRMDAVWEITLSKNVLMIYLKFDSEDEEKKKENFQICFKQDPNSSGDFYFEHDRRGNWITFYYKTAQKLEESSFRALQLLSLLFPPTRYQRITVPLGPRCPDFPFRFLAQLPRGFATFVDLQADQEVECADLLKFLDLAEITKEKKEPWEEQSRLDVRVKVKNSVPCDEITLRGEHLKLPDARFLTSESIKNLDFEVAEIGENHLTSKDFNAFFRAWMTEQTEQKRFRSDKITFHIREDQKINMEEVMEGMNAHVGLPRLRDRFYLRHKTYAEIPNAEAIDCDQGWDIINHRNILGTVLLEPNRLSFFSFHSRFNQRNLLRLMGGCILTRGERINEMKNRQEALERKIAAQGLEPDLRDLERLVIRLPEEMEWYHERVEMYEEIQKKLEVLTN